MQAMQQGASINDSEASHAIRSPYGTTARKPTGHSQLTGANGGYNADVPYSGRMRSYLGGCIIFSRADSFVVWTVILMIAIPALYACLVAPTIIREYSIIPVVATAIIVMYTFSASLMTALTDPGVIPPGIHPQSTLRLIGATDYGSEQTISRLVFHEYNTNFLFGKEIVINDKRSFLKYCGTCQIFRPPRASHCSYCDHCVDEFDHHCHWLSNCVGRRNYRYFVAFISLISLGSLVIVAQVVSQFILLAAKNRYAFWESFLKLWYLVLVFLFCFIPGAVVSALAAYHCVLVTRETSTSEHIKKNRHASSSGNRPIGQVSRDQRKASCLTNFRRTLCGPRLPKLIQWSQFHDAPGLGNDNSHS